MCGKNVEINNRQIRSMMGALASIVQELIQGQPNSTTGEKLNSGSMEKSPTDQN